MDAGEQEDQKNVLPITQTDIRSIIAWQKFKTKFSFSSTSEMMKMNDEKWRGKGLVENTLINTYKKVTAKVTSYE